MRVLLPPSEGKAPGGRGRPLDLDALSFPALTPVRRQLVDALERLAHEDPERLRTALGLTPRQAAEVQADATLTASRTLPALERYTGVLYDTLGYATLTTSRTLPALERYTGVLYDTLAYATLSGPARRRADASLVVASALFGLLRPRDRVPAYRLSGATVLPGLGGLAPLWRPVLEPELAGVRGLVVDLRSGAYAALARVPKAVEVRVLREADGKRSVVSHDNKWTKGRLARALCEHGARTVADVAEVGRTVADDVEVDGRRIDLVLRGLASARQTGSSSSNASASTGGLTR